MTVELSFFTFIVGAVVSLATSWVLVTRLERVGERLGFSEASLGMVAALAADTPEITASITAIAHHQQTVGAGVVLGSNVFNLAALLGLGAVVAGRIDLHRRVVVLGGTVAMIVGVACLLSVGGQVSAGAGLSIVVAVLLGYVALLAAHRSILARLHLPETWTGWLNTAIVEEESELEEAIRPRKGTGRDAVAAARAPWWSFWWPAWQWSKERRRWASILVSRRSSWVASSLRPSPVCPTLCLRCTWPDAAEEPPR